MIQPRLALGGLLALVVALAASACGGFVNPQGWASPVFEGSTTYVFLDKDRLSAVELDGPNGTVAWEFTNENLDSQEGIDFESNYGDPVVDGDILYFVGYEDGLFAIERESGELLWQFDDISGSVIGGPALVDGVLYFGTTEGRVYAIQSDGAPLESWPEGGLNVEDQIYASPIASDGKLFVATMEGTVYAFDPATGEPLWPAPFDVRGAVATLALVSDDTLFVPSFDEHVYLVDTETGEARFPGFETSDWVWATPAVSGSTIYFGNLGGDTYALDITTGEAVWPQPYKVDAKIKAAPAVIDDLVIVLDREPILHFLSPDDGRLLATFPLEDVGTIRANPAEHEGEVFFITTRGRLFRIDTEAMRAVEVEIEELPE